MSRNIYSIVAATVDEKFIAAKTRKLNIVSLLCHTSCNMNASVFALLRYAGWKMILFHACCL